MFFSYAEFQFNYAYMGDMVGKYTHTAQHIFMKISQQKKLSYPN